MTTCGEENVEESALEKIEDGYEIELVQQLEIQKEVGGIKIEKKEQSPGMMIQSVRVAGKSDDEPLAGIMDDAAERREKAKIPSRTTGEESNWEVNVTGTWVTAIQIAQTKDNDWKIIMEENSPKLYVRDGLIREIGVKGERIVLPTSVSEEIARKVHIWMKHFSDEWLISFMKLINLSVL